MYISWRATYLNVRCTRQILRRRIGTMDIVIKRIYEEPSPDDGYRVLVDRLWPRGVSKDKAHLDEWAKDLAP